MSDMQTVVYFSGGSPCPRVRIEKHPSAALVIGDLRIVFEDDRQLREVVEQIAFIVGSQRKPEGGS